ncbi:MAG: molybdopterin-synthase adenylyltransferase MoeB [Pseudomonadota bacterium]
MADFTDSEIERYARHIVMPEIGGAGQQKLKAAQVAVVGVGGLGCPLSLYLVAAGIGTLTVVDDDFVALSNLQRQVMFTADDDGVSKTKIAESRLAALNPDVSIRSRETRLNHENVDELLVGSSVVVDGSDNAQTRQIVADWCMVSRIPLVTGSLYRFDGNVTVIAPWLGPDGRPGSSPQYDELFSTNEDDGAVPDCAEAGILGPIAGVIGTMQAVEVIKMITGIGKPLIGRIIHFDALNSQFETFITASRT